MRKDMFRVIVERPRILESAAKTRRDGPVETMPLREGMRRGSALRRGFKALNENLAPLRRFLMKQVGRPWDKVYGEICEHLRVDSTMQQHVRDHLRDFVEVNPRRGLSTGRSPTRLWPAPLYVDPNDGILKRTDQLPEEKAWRRGKKTAGQAGPVDRIRLSKSAELRRLDGIWYAVSLAPLPMPQYAASTERRSTMRRRGSGNEIVFEDVAVRRIVTSSVVDATGARIPLGPVFDDSRAWRQFRNDYPDRCYVTGKRQLTTKELRRHKLSNAHDEP